MFDEKWYSLENYEGEIWLPLKNFEGIYECSNFGRIKRLPRTWKSGRNNTVVKSLPEGIVKQRIITGGYVKTTLCKNGNKKSYSVHVLVANTFLPREVGKNLVNHKNGTKTDNRIENLEWTTHSENAKHGFRVLGHKKTMAKNRKKISSLAKEIRKEYSENGKTMAELARKYNINYVSIYELIKNKTHKEK